MGEVCLPCRRSGSPKVHMAVISSDGPASHTLDWFLRQSPFNFRYITMHDVHVDTAEDRQLSKDGILREYSDVFNGSLGKVPAVYKMHLDPEVKPVVHPLRRVHVAPQEDVNTERDCTQKLQVIAPVSTPTKWVSSMVAKENKQYVCICIDPCDLKSGYRETSLPITHCRREHRQNTQCQCSVCLMPQVGFGK